MIVNRRTLIGSIFAAVPAIAFAARPTPATRITVYQSPTCGCCGKWADHLKAAGFGVTVVSTPDLSPVARRLGVPDALRSCHTATVGGYFLEGHVPAQDVRLLLRRKPAALGLAVPGMPRGSPGMETGGQRDAFATMLVPKTGAPSVFARHG